MKAKLIFILLSFVLFLFTASDIVAQDIIHLKNKTEPVQAKVVEIGTGNIKYKLWEEKEDGLVYVVEKVKITHIVFENGRTEYFGQEKMDMAEYFEGQKKQAVKISFLGPMIGYTSFGYEKSVKPGQSWEVKASIIGLGIDMDDRNARGFIGSVGYKFLKKPSFVTSDLRRRHILQGGYIKPEFFVGHSSWDDNFFFIQGDERKSASSFGFLLNLGKQWVLGESFVIDLSAGIGFGGGESVRAYYISDDGNVTGTVALDIGFLF